MSSRSANIVADRMRVLGVDHPDTLSTRNSLAGRRGEAGDAAGAVTVLQELLADQVRVLGADHPNTLTIRRLIANLAATGSPVR